MPSCSEWPYPGSSPRTESALLHALLENPTALVVTSSVRAARALRQRYNRMQRANGNQGWATGHIADWESWLKGLWDVAVLRGAETRLLLTDAQELELWRTVLAQDKDAANAYSVASLAELAQRAWKQMHHYEISAKDLRRDSGMDAQAFSRWAAEIEKACRKSSLLSSAWLEAATARHIAAQEVPLPEQIFLLGFDRVTPAQISVIEALKVRGCAIEIVDLQPVGAPESEPAIVCAQTVDDEITSAAFWIRQALLENPNQRIGVIVPDLERLRDAIDATFRRVLAPSSMDVCRPETPLPYEFSLGTPMRRLAPIRTALALLRWMDSALQADDVSWLIVQGEFASADESDARARLDRAFRERRYQMGGPISLPGFRRWLSIYGRAEDVKGFRRAVEALSAFVDRQAMTSARSFAEWRETMEDALTAAEWRLQMPEASEEFQMLKRWNTLLDSFSSLSSVAGSSRFSVAIDRLEHMAARMLFALESRNAPVQISGIPESAGISFDSIWWLNAQASAWPPRGKAQPFLPWSQQREAHMPHADPAEDYAFALRSTRRILGCSKKIVVSFPLQAADPGNSGAHVLDREIVLSPVIREALPNAPIVALEDFLPAAFAKRATTPGVLESVMEEPVVPFQQKHVPGGVQFLELHAACPFRAFAELRLDACALEEPAAGLTPSDQGSIVHKVLENFWQEMRSQENLLRKSEDEVRRTLRGHILHALEAFDSSASEAWQKSLLEVEAARLEDRLIELMEHEKRRAAFTVVQVEARQANAQIAGIELGCRVDRIDQVGQGAVLFDYKTGSVEPKACEGDRPDKPQLPAYAVLRNDTEPLAAVAFASLHPREVGFKVVKSVASVFQNAPAGTARQSKRNNDSLSPGEMREIQSQWNTTLTRLAEEFRSGVAVVDPKQPQVTCRFCAQTLLCRIRETDAGEAADPGDENDSSDDDIEI